MRVLWMSDRPSQGTGFGLVTREVCAGLLARGHHVRNLAWWSTAADRAPGFDIVPCPVSPEGACQAVRAQIEAFRPDILVTLGDLPWVSYLARPPMRAALDRAGLPWCAYFPIDGRRPDGRLPDRWAQTLRQVDLPIAMSAFGVQVCAASGIEVGLIPHGCDTRLFAPRPDRHQRRAALDLADRFVVLSDCRNHRRKMIPRLLDIVRLLRHRRPDAVLLLNTNTRIEDDVESYSYDLLRDIAALGLTGHVRLAKPSGPLDMQDVADLYAMADVHLLTSFGEGFGLPTLQAASAGLVPIAGDHSANTELLGDHGLPIPASGCALDEFGLERPFIDRAAAAAALERLAADPVERQARSQRAVVFAAQFAWPLIVDQWEARLVQANLAPRPPAPDIVQPGGPLRPTGHHADDLPLPRLGIPAFLGPPERRPPRFTVLVDPDHLDALQDLPPLFGPVTLAPIEPGKPPADDVILVVDPAGQAPALRRHPHIAYLGPTDLPDRFDLLTLRLRCREVLTDHLAAARRAGQDERLEDGDGTQGS